jgi:hypothetical protein
MPARAAMPSHVDQKLLALPSFASDRDARRWIDHNWETLLEYQRRSEVAHPYFAIQYVYALGVGRIFHRREADTLPMIERLLGNADR